MRVRRQYCYWPWVRTNKSIDEIFWGLHCGPLTHYSTNANGLGCGPYWSAHAIDVRNFGVRLPTWPTQSEWVEHYKTTSLARSVRAP